MKLLSRVQLFATPWTVAYQAPPSMGFSRQEYWSRLPFPSPRDLPTPGIEPQSPTLQADALPYEPLGKPKKEINKNNVDPTILQYWNSNSLTIWCKQPTPWKRPWCWERLKAGGERDDRGWDGWMASLTPWTWIWASSGSWWWTGKPGVLRFMGSQRAGRHWETELNWTELRHYFIQITSKHREFYSIIYNNL